MIGPMINQSILTIQLTMNNSNSVQASLIFYGQWNGNFRSLERNHARITFTIFRIKTFIIVILSENHDQSPVSPWMFHFSIISLIFSLVVDSNKVKNLASVKEATSVLECIEILQDENLFTPTDVIYMQFLCQEADCFDLFTKCVEYAESKQRALCYFKKPPGKVCWFYYLFFVKYQNDRNFIMCFIGSHGCFVK